MKKFNFLICYDISDVKRLRRVAKSLESVSIRIQKSIFYYMDGSVEDIKSIVKTLDDLIDQDRDDIRIYKVDKYRSINLNSAIDLKKPNIIGVSQ